MKTNIPFYKTLGNTKLQDNLQDKWEEAKILFDENKYLESLYAVLSYIDSNIFKNFGNTEKTFFKIPQGSVIITIEIKNETVFISAPFVKVPATKFMPIFRRCAELNYSVMTLPQVILKEDQLVFEYSCPLETCAPYKFYSALRDIAQNADKYDDEFIDRFGAERIIEPMSSLLDDASLEKCLDTIKKIAKDSLEKSTKFENKRIFNNAFYAIYVGLKQIDYYCQPSGMFSNKLDDSIDSMFDKNKDIIAKMKMGKLFLDNIANMEVKELKDAVFYNYCLINVKRNLNRKGISNWIENLFFSTVAKYKEEEYIATGYLGLYTFYTLLANFNIDQHSQDCIEYVLRITAEKEFSEEICQEFLDLMEFFYDNDEDEYEKVVMESNANSGVTSDIDFKKITENAMNEYQNMFGNIMKMFNK